jgi:type I restriction-modification system DNA methylase subunit
VPKEARWNILNQRQAADLGKIIDDAMVAIEKENPTLKGVLTKDYSRPSLDKYRLGELIDISARSDLETRNPVRKIFSAGCTSIFSVASLLLRAMAAVSFTRLGVWSICLSG